MDLPELLQNYGYVAVFLGTFIEGETMLLLGSYAARRGYLDLAWVIGTAFTAALCADQLFFHLGRRHGAQFLARWPGLRARVDTALHRAERHSALVVIAMRFMWGLRIALPLAIGMGPMRARRFLLLDIVAAALWSCFFGLFGFAASGLLAQFITNLRDNEQWIIVALLVLAGAVLVHRWWSGRRRAQASPD